MNTSRMLDGKKRGCRKNKKKTKWPDMAQSLSSETLGFSHPQTPQKGSHSKQQPKATGFSLQRTSASLPTGVPSGQPKRRRRSLTTNTTTDRDVGFSSQASLHARKNIFSPSNTPTSIVHRNRSPRVATQGWPLIASCT